VELMKRVFAGTVLALFCAAGLAAQMPAADQKKAEPAKSDEKSVTITGCLRAGETPNSYVLANVKKDDASTTAAATPSTPPSAAAGTSGSMASEVKLIGAPASLDLSKHVGHTVAITGSWAAAGKSSQPTGTTGAAGAASPSSSARSFNVKSMTHQSETCK
jgi:hypothetical protein